MSNLQLPHDVNVNKDRISPSEMAEADKEKMQQEEAEHNDPQGEAWVPPGNKDQGSRKS
jgi:hypothetical protein